MLGFMTDGSTPRECSIASAMAVIGERWTPLVLRELVFGVHRFGDIATATGAPRDLLAKRLKSLEAHGLIERRRYQERPPRFEYHLSRSGADAGDVLLALMAFGDEHLRPEPPVRWHHGSAEAAHELTPILVCSQCGEPARSGLHSPTGPGAPTTTATATTTTATTTATTTTADVSPGAP